MVQPAFQPTCKNKHRPKFLTLVKKHFPKDHKLHKIFNPNTIKISCSCMPCVGAIVKQHNSYVRRQEKADENSRACNCRTPRDCPRRGECLASEIVYCAKVTVPSNDCAEAVYWIDGYVIQAAIRESQVELHPQEQRPKGTFKIHMVPEGQADRF